MYLFKLDCNIFIQIFYSAERKLELKKYLSTIKISVVICYSLATAIFPQCGLGKEINFPIQIPDRAGLNIKNFAGVLR